MDRARLHAVVLVTCLAWGTTTFTTEARGALADAPPILVSRQLFENRGLRIGGLVRLSADRSGAGARWFRIEGVYEPTADPLRLGQQRLEVRFHLPDFLALVGDSPDPAAAQSITSINVALDDSSEALVFASDVAARVPGLVARPTSGSDERTSTFVVLERFHLAIAIVTVIGSALFLLALMVMVAEERRGTVAVLRLIGFTRRRILLQVFAEGALIAAAGAAVGIVFAIAVQDAFNRFFQWRYDTTLVFLRISPAVIARSLLLALPFGVAASVLASWALLRQRLLALTRW